MSEHHYLNIIQKLDADHPQMFKIDILSFAFSFLFLFSCYIFNQISNG